MNRPDIPLLSKEGWLRDQENIAQPPLNAQTGWFLSSRKFELPNHPGRSYQRLLRGIFLKVASTPPWKGGEYRANSFTFFSPRVHVPSCCSLRRAWLDVAQDLTE